MVLVIFNSECNMFLLALNNASLNPFELPESCFNEFETYYAMTPLKYRSKNSITHVFISGLYPRVIYNSCISK